MSRVKGLELEISIYNFDNQTDYPRVSEVMRRLQNFGRHEFKKDVIRTYNIGNKEDLFDLFPKESFYSIGIYHGGLIGQESFSINEDSNKAIIFLDYSDVTMDTNKEVFFLIYCITRISFVFLRNHDCLAPNCICNRMAPNSAVDFFKEFALLHFCKECKRSLENTESTSMHLTEYLFDSLRALFSDENALLRSELFNKNKKAANELTTCFRSKKRAQNIGLLEWQKQSLPFKETFLIIVLHLLPDFLFFLEILEDLGANPKSTAIIVKPYPYKNLEFVLNEALSRGFKVALAKESDLSGDVGMRQKADVFFQEALNSGLPTLIIEDGGYLVPYYHETDFKNELQIIGAVEQTTKGIRNDEVVKKLLFPVINVAESKFKKEYESPLIGEVATRNITRLVPDEYLSGKKAIVFGFGSVGAQIAEQLRWLGMMVEIVENDLIKHALARKKGFRVHRPDSTDMMEGCFLAIGTTGQCSIKREHIRNIKNKTTYLASTSSDRIEIDIDELESEEMDKETIQGVGTKYKISGTESEITLLADGYPVNFYHAESVPNKAIDPIMGMLLNSALYLSFAYINKKQIESRIDTDIANKLSESVIYDFLGVNS